MSVDSCSSNANKNTALRNLSAVGSNTTYLHCMRILTVHLYDIYCRQYGM